MCVCVYIYIYIHVMVFHTTWRFHYSNNRTTCPMTQHHIPHVNIYIHTHIYIYIYMVFHTSRFHYSNKRATCPMIQHHIPHEPLQKSQISQYRNWFMNLPSYNPQNHYQELQKDTHTHIYAFVHPNKCTSHAEIPYYLNCLKICLRLNKHT